jgi:hypothetical protein
MDYTSKQTRLQRILGIVRESRQSILSFPVDPDIYRELKKYLLRPAHRGGR